MKTDQFVHLVAFLAVFAIFTASASTYFDIAAAQTEDEIEWLDAEEFTLYWGDQVNTSGYVIESLEYSIPRYSDMPDDYVIFSILLTNTSKSWSTILSVNNSNIPGYDIFDNKFKLEVVDIVTGIDIPTPYTKIKFYLAKELPIEEYLKRTWINKTVAMEKSAGYDIYIDERVYVTIEIENLKDIYFEDVRLNENIPDNFVVDPDEDIGWTFDLKNNGKLTYSYSLKSTRAGEFTLPATELMLTHLGITHYKYTNATNMTIHGPTIIVSKTIDSIPSNETLSNVILNDVINITVNVGNEGDRAAHVYISDEIPAGTTKVSGETSADMVLQPSSNYTMQYSIKMGRIGDIIIPSANAKFLDAKGYGDTVGSNKYIISVIEEQTSVEVEPVQEVEIENETSQPIPQLEEPEVEVEQSLVDKVKSIPSKAMELPGFSALGLVFAIVGAGAILSVGANTADKDKRKK